MSSKKLEPLEDELTPTDIALAATMSRKSLRRSMIPLEYLGSPIRCSPNKVRRKSIAAFIGSPAGSPIASSTTRFRRLSCVPGKLFSPSKESTPQQTAVDSPIPNEHNQSKPVLSPVRNPSPKKMDVDDEPQAVNQIPISKESKAKSSPPICQSVEDVMRNYERELEEWPKFLARLEAKATSPFQPSLTPDEIMKDSVLKPFVEFILPNQRSWPSCAEFLQRIQRSYSQIMVGLVRTRLEQEKITSHLAALHEIKLKELLPKSAENPRSVSRKQFSAFVTYLDEID